MCFLSIDIYSCILSSLVILSDTIPNHSLRVKEEKNPTIAANSIYNAFSSTPSLMLSSSFLIIAKKVLVQKIPKVGYTPACTNAAVHPIYVRILGLLSLNSLQNTPLFFELFIFSSCLSTHF